MTGKTDYIPSWVFKVGTVLLTAAVGLLGITFAKILEINADIAILKERTAGTWEIHQMVWSHEERIEQLEEEANND